jgi:hypothetical protein
MTMERLSGATYDEEARTRSTALSAGKKRRVARQGASNGRCLGLVRSTGRLGVRSVGVYGAAADA